MGVWQAPGFLETCQFPPEASYRRRDDQVLATRFAGHKLGYGLVAAAGFTVGDTFEALQNVPVGKRLFQFAWPQQEVRVAGAAKARLICSEGFVNYQAPGSYCFLDGCQ